MNGLIGCAVCYGAAGAPVTQAMDMAILFLLGVILSVLGGVGAFAFYLKRQGAMPLPPHEEIAQQIEEEGLE
jgi:hypothetical protein